MSALIPNGIVPERRACLKCLIEIHLIDPVWDRAGPFCFGVLKPVTCELNCIPPKCLPAARTVFVTFKDAVSNLGNSM